MIYFSSDWHLGHENVLQFDSRPFASIQEHDEHILAQVNATCGINDDLYFLGDFTKSKKKEIIHAYISRIHCRLHFVFGNHDDDIRKFLKQFPELVTSFQDAAYIKYQKQKIYLHHYSCRTWRSSQYGSWHLYGHSHGKLENRPHGKSMDVAVHLHDYKPISFDQVKAIMDARELVCLDHTIRIP